MALTQSYVVTIETCNLQTGIDIWTVAYWGVNHCRSFIKTKIIAFDYMGFVIVDFIFGDEQDALLFTLRFK